MTLIAWLSDVHFDDHFVTEVTVKRLARECRARADKVLITGDIAEAATLRRKLGVFQKTFGREVLYILGNHDRYGAGIAQMEINLEANPIPGCTYLNPLGPIELSSTVCLVGIDGYFDGRNGNIHPDWEMRDFSEIQELAPTMALPRGMPRELFLREQLAILGDRAVVQARSGLGKAIDKYDHVIFATHVSPFAEGAWHRNKPPEAHSLPFYTCYAMGELLVETALSNPDKKITVLSGHSHCYRHYWMTDNLECYASFAEYRDPGIMRIIQVGEIEEHPVLFHRINDPIMRPPGLTLDNA